MSYNDEDDLIQTQYYSTDDAILNELDARQYVTTNYGHYQRDHYNEDKDEWQVF